jgi:eukaryotic-like serine/threonine-protein kinase
MMTKIDDTCPSGTGGRRPTNKGQLPVGTVAGAYVITELLGRGGSGFVYRAKHRELGWEAAVKVMHASLAVQPKMVERFVREVHVLGLLQHPNIIEVFEVGSLPDGRPYYVMEYLEGRTVSAILDAQGRLSPAEALDVLGPVCSALEAAHAAGIIHRDVKAGNIMVVGDGPTRVKLLDFGIAKMVDPRSGNTGITTDGRQLGTLSIMAPEQLLGAPVDARIDVYALGILLFRLLTGQLPFQGKNAQALAQHHIETPAPRPSQHAPLPPAFDAIVLRCLEKQPDRRYPTVREFYEALRRAASGVTGARGRDSDVLVPALGVYVEIRMNTSGDDVDEALGDDTSSILDLAEEALEGAGFLVASSTGSEVLGVLPLPADPTRARCERRAAIAAMAALRARIDERPDADPRVRVNVCVHAADVVVRGGSPPEIVGGPLIRTELWVPRDDAPGLAGTREAIEGLTDLDLTPGPGGLVTIAERPGSARC